MRPICHTPHPWLYNISEYNRFRIVLLRVIEAPDNTLYIWGVSASSMVFMECLRFFRRRELSNLHHVHASGVCWYELMAGFLRIQYPCAAYLSLYLVTDLLTPWFHDSRIFLFLQKLSVTH